MTRKACLGSRLLRFCRCMSCLMFWTLALQAGLGIRPIKNLLPSKGSMDMHLFQPGFLLCRASSWATGFASNVKRSVQMYSLANRKNNWPILALCGTSGSLCGKGQRWGLLHMQPSTGTHWFHRNTQILMTFVLDSGSENSGRHDQKALLKRSKLQSWKSMDLFGTPISLLGMLPWEDWKLTKQGMATFWFRVISRVLMAFDLEYGSTTSGQHDQKALLKRSKSQSWTNMDLFGTPTSLLGMLPWEDWKLTKQGMATFWFRVISRVLMAFDLEYGSTTSGQHDQKALLKRSKSQSWTNMALFGPPTSLLGILLWENWKLTKQGMATFWFRMISRVLMAFGLEYGSATSGQHDQKAPLKRSKSQSWTNMDLFGTPISLLGILLWEDWKLTKQGMATFWFRVISRVLMAFDLEYGSTSSGHFRQKALLKRSKSQSWTNMDLFGMPTSLLGILPWENWKLTKQGMATFWFRVISRVLMAFDLEYGSTTSGQHDQKAFLKRSKSQSWTNMDLFGTPISLLGILLWENWKLTKQGMATFWFRMISRVLMAFGLEYGSASSGQHDQKAPLKRSKSQSWTNMDLFGTPISLLGILLWENWKLTKQGMATFWFRMISRVLMAFGLEYGSASSGQRRSWKGANRRAGQTWICLGHQSVCSRCCRGKTESLQSKAWPRFGSARFQEFWWLSTWSMGQQAADSTIKRHSWKGANRRAGQTWICLECQQVCFGYCRGKTESLQSKAWPRFGSVWFQESWWLSTWRMGQQPAGSTIKRHSWKGANRRAGQTWICLECQQVCLGYCCGKTERYWKLTKQGMATFWFRVISRVLMAFDLEYGSTTSGRRERRAGFPSKGFRSWRSTISFGTEEMPVQNRGAQIKSSTAVVLRSSFSVKHSQHMGVEHGRLLSIDI